MTLAGGLSYSFLLSDGRWRRLTLIVHNSFGFSQGMVPAMPEGTHDMANAHCYFFMVPNIVDDDQRLTPHDFRLYCHLKRVAGDEGVCFQSNKTIMKATGMSKPTVLKSKKKLKELEYIEVVARKGNTDLIYIEDIWSRNIGKYLANSVEKGGMNLDPGGGKDFDQGVANICTPKKNPLRKTHKEERERNLCSSSLEENEHVTYT